MKIIFMFFLLGIILSEADNKKVPKKKLTRLEKDQKRIARLKKRQRKLEESEKVCNPELLVSYGFSYRQKPVKQLLNMCTGIYSSCCSIEDQNVIYSSWVLQEEEKRIDEKFDWIKKIYRDLLKNLESVQKIAENLQKSLEKKPVSNCQILSRRLVQMQIDYIRPKLEEQITHMFTFLKKSFKGIYCMICDSQAQKYINVEKNEITFADGFCREAIVNVLHPQMYLHDLLHKYINIVTKFMISCNHEGKFKDRAPNPKYLFHIEYKNRRILNTCHENVNKVDWLESCENVCKKLDITKFNRKFIAPNIRSFMDYNDYIAQEIKDWEQEEREAKQDKASQGRLLEEKSPEVKKNKTLDPNKMLKINQLRKFSDDFVFTAAMNSMVDLDKMEKKYDSQGIDLYLIGNQSVITRRNYKDVQKLITSRKLKQIKKIKKERELRGASFIGVLIANVSILFLLN